MKGEKMLSLGNIPIKNIKTHKVRSIILFLLTLAQAACLFSGAMMIEGMRQELAQAQARLGADLLVYPTAAVSKISKDKLFMQGTPVEVYRDRSMLARMDSCDGIGAVSHQIYISDTAEDGSQVWITGYEPETDFVLSPWLEAGEDIHIPRGSLLLGSKVKPASDNTVTLYGKKWPVAARLMETGSSMDTSVFVSMETMEDMIGAAREAGIEKYSSLRPGSDFSVALVRVKDKNKVESVTNWINIYVRKVTAVRSEAILTQAASGIQGTSRAMAVIAGLAWLVLAIALGITQSILMKERTGEMYVWHSIGASRNIMNKVMLSEAAMVYLAGAAAGIVLAGLAFGLFGRVILAGAAPGPVSFLLAGLMALILTLAAGLAATYLAVKRAAKSLDGQMLLTL